MPHVDRAAVFDEAFDAARESYVHVDCACGDDEGSGSTLLDSMLAKATARHEKLLAEAIEKSGKPEAEYRYITTPEGGFYQAILD
ncbi:MAG: hypothetical protein Q3972_06865 [Corynebacterium sp.]|nr:hypothetical protein [Corynebacterium sp.]